MHHSATVQPYAGAVYILINALYFFLYHTMTSSCLQNLPFHSPVYNTYSMYVCTARYVYVMEDN